MGYNNKITTYIKVMNVQTNNLSIRMMNGCELCEFMEVFKLNNKNSSILNPSIITYNNGDVYRGEIDILRGYLYHGYGEIVYACGDVFATKWNNGVAHGSGVYIYANGVDIRGKWNNGIIDGNKCIIKLPNDDIYNNVIYNSTILYGSGILSYTDGEIYNGEFVNGIKTGYGITYWPNGYIYEGYWYNDTLNGYGVLYTHDKIYTGLWHDGVQDLSGEILSICRDLLV